MTKFQSAPVNCKADRLSGFCTSRTKTSAIRTRHNKTTLLVTKGVNGHFRTLRAITYKKILNKSNAILAACLHLLATFGLQCRAFACGGGGGGGRASAPCPFPSTAYESGSWQRCHIIDSFHRCHTNVYIGTTALSLPLLSQCCARFRCHSAALVFAVTTLHVHIHV